MRRASLVVPNLETPLRRGLRKRAKPTKLAFARAMRKHQTPTESLLWQYLRKRHCAGFRFRRQAVILGWIVDFYCPEKRLVVEVDGLSHANRAGKDRRRDEVMCNAGIAVLRLSAALVEHDTEAALAHIRRALKQRRLPSNKSLERSRER
jgi:very-short-patch-repair endonuclease